MENSQRSTTHPDENLLAAFAERTLRSAERERVLVHLSDCADCRDVVFLAQQAAPELEFQAGLLPSQIEWRNPRVPRWRWPAIAATGLLSAALIFAPVWMYRHAARPTPQRMAATSMSPLHDHTEGIAPRSAEEESNTSQAVASPSGRSTAPQNRDFHSHSNTTAAGRLAAPSRQPALSIAEATSAASPTPSPVDGALHASPAMPGLLAGLVTDTSGAAIPGAKVSLRSHDATSREAVTDPAGHFAIPAVPPGNYTIEFKAAGFQAAARDVDVPAQNIAALSETLAPGSASQTVSVSADAAATPLQTENSQLQATINGKEVSPLLQNGRNFSLSQAVPRPSAPAVAHASARAVVPSSTIFSIKDGAMQRCRGQVCSALVVPSPAAIVSAAFDGRIVLAIDANGNLFSSQDQGEHWFETKPQWQGKLINAKVASTPSASSTASRSSFSKRPWASSRASGWAWWVRTARASRPSFA